MDWTEILQQFLPITIRLIIIIFSTLGVVYMTGRLLFEKLSDKQKNVIAFFALIIISFAVTLLRDYPELVDGINNRLDVLNYVLDSILYATAGCVFYVSIGWRWYSRVDALLDRKFAKDDKRKQ